LQPYHDEAEQTLADIVCVGWTEDRRRGTEDGADSGLWSSVSIPNLQPPVFGLRSVLTMPENTPHEIPRYKFQKLDVYGLALEYADIISEIAKRLPGAERFNLRGQIEAAVAFVVLNIAEGSTGQTDPEQQRFLSFSIRSFLETVACIDLIERRRYVASVKLIEARQFGRRLFVKLQAFRNSLE